MNTIDEYKVLKTSQNCKNYGTSGLLEPTLPDLEQQQLRQRQTTQARNIELCASIGAAGLLFICGGIIMPFEIGHHDVHGIYRLYMYSNICWFRMAIIGAVISSGLTYVLKKKTFLFISSVLILISGILMQVSDHQDTKRTALHFNGFGIGLLFVPALVMAGEEAPAEHRGKISSFTEITCFSFGVFLKTIPDSRWIRGALPIVFSIISLCIVFFIITKSPAYFLVRNLIYADIDFRDRIQRFSEMSEESNEQLESLKTYVAYNNDKSRIEIIRESLPGLIKLCFLRAVVGMSFSFAIYMNQFVKLQVEWVILLYMANQFAGSLASVFLQDAVGRKKPLAFGIFVSGIIVLSIALSFRNQSEWYLPNNAIYMFGIYQFFFGFAITSSSSYLSEAFPLAIKPYCIAFAFTAQMLTQVLSVIYYYHKFITFAYTLGVFSLACFVLTIYCLPETKKTTLHEAQIKFQGYFNKN